MKTRGRSSALEICISITLFQPAQSWILAKECEYADREWSTSTSSMSWLISSFFKSNAKLRSFTLRIWLSIFFSKLPMPIFQIAFNQLEFFFQHINSQTCNLETLSLLLDKLMVTRKLSYSLLHPFQNTCRSNHFTHVNIQLSMLISLIIYGKNLNKFNKSYPKHNE